MYIGGVFLRIRLRGSLANEIVCDCIPYIGAYLKVRCRKNAVIYLYNCQNIWPIASHWRSDLRIGGVSSKFWVLFCHGHYPAVCNIVINWTTTLRLYCLSKNGLNHTCLGFAEICIICLTIKHKHNFTRPNWVCTDDNLNSFCYG